jgi:2,5-diketo-D-gluconate reductase A
MSDLGSFHTLRSGARMPLIGLGTYPLSNRAAEAAVASALDAGYRLIDTAQSYGNEAGVGRGIRASGIPREDIFLTTKLRGSFHGVAEARDGCAVSIERLQVDYLDLLLIHWPLPGQNRYVEAVAGLGELRAAGLIRAIGTSNFKPAHLQRVFDETGLTPDVNQIELNPVVPRPEPRAFHAAHDILTQAWGPIGRDTNLLRDPVITALASRYERTPAQIVLRWHLQLGTVPIPKSQNPARQRENLGIFDFALDDEALSKLATLDRGEKAAVDSDSFP